MTTRQYGSRGARASNTSSPATASGSTGANSTPSPASASAPGWMVASAPWAFWGSLIILTSLALRWIPFNWGLMLFFAILGGGASLLLKKSKTISFFRWMAGGIILTTILSAWFFPQLPAAVESYQPGVSSPQEQVASPSPPPEEIPSTGIVVVSGKKITLTGDGTYSVPMGRKSLCLTNLGMKDGSQYVVQDVTVAGVEYIFSGTECKSLPYELEGDVIIDFFPGKDHGTPRGFKKLYKYWKSQPGGQAEWPVIRIGE